MGFYFKAWGKLEAERLGPNVRTDVQIMRADGGQQPTNGYKVVPPSGDVIFLLPFDSGVKAGDVLSASSEEWMVVDTISVQGGLHCKVQRVRRQEPPGLVESKPATPDFSFVRDDRIRKILQRDYAELDRLDSGIATKAVLVLSGGIIEALLLDALLAQGKWTFEDGSRKFLKELIGPATGAGIIREVRLTEAVRRYRDLIHPGREIREGLVFSKADADVARAAVDVVIREIAHWHTNRIAEPS